MLVLGDAHADEQSNRRALLAAYEEADVDTALQMGDLLYYDLPLPTWFIAGNNEDLDVIESVRTGSDSDRTTNAHLLASTAVESAGIRIAGLSGNYVPTQFDKGRADLQDDRRRHFVREDIERVMELTEVDVFLTHEAPHGLLQSDGYDVGCKYVDGILRNLNPDSVWSATTTNTSRARSAKRRSSASLRSGRAIISSIRRRSRSNVTHHRRRSRRAALCLRSRVKWCSSLAIETFWAPRSVDESPLDRSHIAFDVGVERTPLQIEEFEQKDRDEDAENPEQYFDVGEKEVMEDDRDRDARSNEAERGNEPVRPGHVGELEVRVVRDGEREKECDGAELGKPLERAEGGERGCEPAHGLTGSRYTTRYRRRSGHYIRTHHTADTGNRQGPIRRSGREFPRSWKSRDR